MNFSVMNLKIVIPIVVALACSHLRTAERCQAQNVTVQLPTFEVTGVSTTVLVPDSGSLFLGGVNRSSLGSQSFGPGVPGLGNRGFGRAIDAGGMSISATIIDHSEIDRALLAEAARRRGATVDIRGRPVADAPRLSPAVTRRSAAVRARDGRNSLAPVRYRPSRRNADAELAATYLDRAQRSEAKGEPMQAKIFYRRVVKHGDTALKRQAEAKLAQLDQQTQR